MNYCAGLTQPRQAVLKSVCALILFAAAPVFGQQPAPQTKLAEPIQTVAANAQLKDEKDSAPAEPEKPTETKKQILADEFSKSEKTSEFNKNVLPSAGITTDFTPPKKSNDLSKTSSQQQQPDDSMMGVMGRRAEKSRFGGHVGFVVPITGRGNNVTTTLADRFVFGFPVGLTVKTRKNIAVDFEFIPTFNTGRDFVLTIHPGIIYGFAKKYAVGVRAAYDAGNASFGLTPLVSRGFKINDKIGFFIEADFPIRSNYRPYVDRFGSIAVAAHAGFAF